VAIAANVLAAIGSDSHTLFAAISHTLFYKEWLLVAAL